VPVDYYPQKTEEELLALLKAVQARGTDGQVFFTTVIGMQTQKSFQGAARPEVEIRRIRYSLFLKNPDTYANPYTERTRRTRANYYV